MSSPNPRPSPQSSSSRRPHSIAELADRALYNLWDPSRGLKQWLKAADGFRKAGRAFSEVGEFEAAFVEFAKAATIILEKLPTHKEYYTLLTATQRHNLGLNGQNILENLGELKPTLVDRYERWAARNPEEAAAASNSNDSSSRRQDESRVDRHSVHDESGWQAQEAARRDADRRRDESRRREEARRADEARYRAVDQRTIEHQHRLEIDTATPSRSRRKDDALAAARRAANISRESSLVRRDRSERSGSEPVTPVSAEERRRERDDVRFYQEGTRRREEEEVVRRRSREQDGIMRRQQEAEAASRAARRSVVPSPAHIAVPSALNSQRSSLIEQPIYEDAVPPSMPLESPTRPSYPIPVTTTSPAPPDGQVRYPQLMSQHQLTQGYTPSLQSMFSYPTLKPSNVGPSSLLFIPDASKTHPNNLYSSSTLPRPSAPVVPAAPPISATQYPTAPAQQGHSSSFNTLSRTQGAPPPPPPPLHHVDGDRFRTASQESARITRDRAVEDRVPELKAVSLPRDCLPRFLSIAALNTSRNRETCGLLLGRDQKGKFVVTTLLIPRQHSTSDTCTMDEEELVMQFTEERSLITLGWIHTHPSQSCFMSSVDLHTHSGFQRMLPESFAVVCAPKSTPNFGIFRLTDPPGLQTILNCSAKEAFHPHPDLPIYTDADKGHVQMKDMPLEIVDLR
ncbi:hypothetical protein HYDPIDRAFT_89553 [Hydnomerulius pinastri MD-312]|uniref:MPN domain-containing protein n=1 Tax=Hydnomerulius pinastri MD-312 TaxID=994086 RepID=A0A0C9WAD9_9AGAM|nr:hypothetical protein HYDPIDRAFT_89553 [Hydnomerulius pinastri MD-312]